MIHQNFHTLNFTFQLLLRHCILVSKFKDPETEKAKHVTNNTDAFSPGSNLTSYIAHLLQDCVLKGLGTSNFSS